MGLSGSKQTSSYTPSAQQTQAASMLTNAYQTQAPKTQAIADNIASLIPGLQSAIPATSQAVGQAAGYYGDVLGGKYLDAGNPYLSGIVNSSANDITDRVNSIFSSSGRTGSDAHAYALSKGLSESENNLRYSDYNNQMGRMDSAASAAGGLSAQTLASILGLGTTAAGLPLGQASQYASGIGSLGIGGTTTTKSSPSLGAILAQMAGNAANAFAMGG